MDNIVNNSNVRLVAALIVLLFLIIVASWLTRRKTKVLNTQKFKTRWHEAQKFCSSKNQTHKILLFNENKTKSSNRERRVDFHVLADDAVERNDVLQHSDCLVERAESGDFLFSLFLAFIEAFPIFIHSSINGISLSVISTYSQVF